MRSTLLALALASVAFAQNDAGVTITVAPQEAPEGLPVDFQVTLAPADAPVAITAVRVRFGFLGGLFAQPRCLHGVWAAPVGEGAVTVELVLSEGDLGPVARAPMPPRTIACGPDNFIACRMLAKGQELTVTLPGTPLECRPSEVQVDVDYVPLADLRVDDLKPILFEAGAANASLGLGKPSEGPEGEGTAGVTTRSWRPGEPSGEEVLVDATVLGKAKIQRMTSSFPVKTSAQATSSTAACARAKIDGKSLLNGTWLESIGAWVFEAPEQSWVVPKEGEPHAHRGRLAALAARMTEGGPVELHGPPGSDLKPDLDAAGIRSDEGKMLMIQARAEQLVALLGVLEKRGLVIEGDYVAEAPPDSPTPRETPPPEQGVRVPCADCKVIRPGLSDCPTCHGTGVRSLPLRMVDEPGQRAAASARRKAVDEAVAKAKSLHGEESHAAWDAAAKEMRAALDDLLAFGAAYAAAYDGREAPPSHPDLRAAFVDRVKAQLREGILDAEGRLGAR